MFGTAKAPGVGVRGLAGPHGGDDGREVLRCGRRPVFFPENCRCYKPLAHPAVEVLFYQVSYQIVVGINVHFAAGLIPRSQSVFYEDPPRASLRGISRRPTWCPAIK